MKIVVTGGAGRLGQLTTRELVAYATSSGTPRVTDASTVGPLTQLAHPREHLLAKTPIIQ